MTRADQAYVRRLDARRASLLTALQVIKVWLISPYCAESAEDMCARILKFAETTIRDEEAAKCKEEERKRKEADNG